MVNSFKSPIPQSVSKGGCANPPGGQKLHEQGGVYQLTSLSTCTLNLCDGKSKNVANKHSSSQLRCCTATGTHMPYGITQCYLPPDSDDIPAFTPAKLVLDLVTPAGYIPRRCTCPKTVTHPSTNQAWCRETSFIHQTTLTTMPCHQLDHSFIYGPDVVPNIECINQQFKK